MGTRLLYSNANVDAKDAFDNCKTKAQKYGYDYFGLQNNGKECWSSKDAFKTYRKYGCSSKCEKTGDLVVGLGWANFVYHLKGGRYDGQ